MVDQLAEPRVGVIGDRGEEGFGRAVGPDRVAPQASGSEDRPGLDDGDAAGEDLVEAPL
ncbi:hypothetical protein [Methylobacterium sp. WL116]|uniref:hypothetical protein n=1 Tax=Methylobacterium sp. WL116 TaxID=2603889 RepID=UPI001650B3CD|nr:hypothetical protein [Methylobacterium sp. WL116]